MQGNKVIWASDISSKPLIEKVIPMVQQGKSHIVCPDLIKVLSHNPKVVNSLIGTINSLTEEGLKNILYNGQEKEYPEPVCCGFISAITPEELRTRERHWRNIGFMSRLLPISFKYNGHTIEEIHDNIQKEMAYPEPEYEKMLKKSQYVTINPEVEGRMIRELALVQRTITKNPTGFRIHHQIRAMVKAIALQHKRKEVTGSDITELQEMLQFMNFNYKEI